MCIGPNTGEVCVLDGREACFGQSLERCDLFKQQDEFIFTGG